MTKLFKRVQDITIICPNCGKLDGYKMEVPLKSKIVCPKCSKDVKVKKIGKPYDIPN